MNRKKIGIIEEGAQADLILWNLKGIEQIPYYNTESEKYITHIIKKGRVFDKQPKVKAPRIKKEKKENQEQ